MQTKVEQTSSFKQNERLVDALLRDLDAIQQGRVEGRPLEAHALLQFLTRQVPGLTGIMSNTRRSVANASNFFRTLNSSTPLIIQASRALPIAGAAIDLVNFLIFPISAVICRLLTGKWPALKLTTTAKIAYATLLLTLSLLAIFVPVTAPFIALTSLGLATGMALWSVYNVNREQRHLRAKWESFKSGSLKQQLDNAAAAFHQLRISEQFDERAAALTIRLQSPEDDPQLLLDIHALQTDYARAKAPYQHLLDRQAHVKQKHSKIIQLSYTVDKIVGLGLLSLAFTGIALALALPPLAPIGFAMAAGSLGLLATYGLARFIYTIGSSLFAKSSDKAIQTDENRQDDFLRDSPHILVEGLAVSSVPVNNIALEQVRPGDEPDEDVVHEIEAVQTDSSVPSL